jgi:hypothetical protein
MILVGIGIRLVRVETFLLKNLIFILRPKG